MSADSHMSGAVDRRAGRSAIERLYVYWLSSTVVLIVALVVLAFFVRGAVLQQHETLRELQRRVNQLEGRPAAGEPPRPPAATQPATQPAAEDARVERPAAPLRATPPPGVAATRPREAVVGAPADRPASASLDQRLAQVARRPVRAPDDVLDRAAAHALLDDLADARVAATTAELAVDAASLALVLDREGQAAGIIRAAPGPSKAAANLAEAGARAALLDERADDAVDWLDAADAHARDDPSLALLRVRADALQRGPAAAAAAAERVDAARLSLGDRAALARLWLSLERWPQFEAAAAALLDPPCAGDASVNFIRAVALQRGARLVEALAAFDSQLARRAEPGDENRTADAPASTELQVWRGLTLASGGALEAARAALLAAAETEPAAGAVYVALARVEMGSGEPGRARTYLDTALAHTPDSASAWETRAALELNQNAVAAAVESAGRAIDSDPGRSSSRMLRALALAKLERREAAADDLAAALRLDASLLDEALQAEVLTRMFATDELRAMSRGEWTTSAPATQPGM